MANYIIGGLIVVLVFWQCAAILAINMALAAAAAVAAAPIPENVIQISK